MLIKSFISFCVLLLLNHSAVAFDKKHLCFYQPSTKQINCDCESRKGRVDVLPRYFCLNAEGIWEIFDKNQKTWQELTTERILFKFYGKIKCYNYLKFRAERREVKNTLLL